MPTGIRYRISNRLMADNTAFYRLSGINPITGNPIYRNSFTHSSGSLSMTQATAIAAYLSELMIFSIASTGFIPTHCITWRNTDVD